MKKVEMFIESASLGGVTRIEKSINTWVEEHDVEVVDIKITSKSNETSGNIIAMIIYEIKER